MRPGKIERNGFKSHREATSDAAVAISYQCRLPRLRQLTDPRNDRTRVLKLVQLLILMFFLSGCALWPNAVLSPGDDNAPPVSQAAQTTLTHGRNLGLGDGEVQFSFDKPKDPSVSSLLSVISGRLLPVFDQQKQSVVAWRLVGEILNEGKNPVVSAETVVELVSSRSGEPRRTVIPDPAQSGGFVPLEPGEREVYDALILGPVDAWNVSIGMRIADDEDKKADPVRLEISNLTFFQTGSGGEVGGQTTYHVSGTVKNTGSSPVKNLLVRYWAVIELPEVPPGAKTNDQVVAVGTWTAPQDVLASGDERNFESILTPLSVADGEKIVSGSAGLSALGMGTPLKP